MNANVVAASQTAFPIHLVYLFIAGIGIIVVGTLILLDRKKK